MLKAKLSSSETYDEKNRYLENHIEHIMKFVGDRDFKKYSILKHALSKDRKGNQKEHEHKCI